MKKKGGRDKLIRCHIGDHWIKQGDYYSTFKLLANKQKRHVCGACLIGLSKHTLELAASSKDIQRALGIEDEPEGPVILNPHTGKPIEH